MFAACVRGPPAVATCNTVLMDGSSLRPQGLDHTEGAWFELLHSLRGDPRQMFAVGPLSAPASEWECFSAGIIAHSKASGLQLCVGSLLALFGRICLVNMSKQESVKVVKRLHSYSVYFCYALQRSVKCNPTRIACCQEL